MYTIITPQGFTVGFIADSRQAVRWYMQHSYGMTHAGWLECKIRKHDAWPDNTSTVYDVSKEKIEIEALLSSNGML